MTILATVSVFTHTRVEQPAEPLLTALLKLKLIDEDGDGPDEDQWDGYPAERSRLLELLRGIPDTVLLSGDLHVSIAGEVRDDDGAVAVELTT